MSTAPQIDYAAIAKQYGATSSVPAGTPDYAAIAKQFGATDSKPAGFSNQQFQQEVKAQSTPKEQPGFVSQVGQQTKDLGLGFLKSAMQTQASSPIGTTLPGMSSAQPVDVHDPAITPKGAAQHVGAALEQTGEMALTGGPLRGMLQNAAMKVPLLGKYLGPGARVAAEAINTSANAAGHGQDPNSAALVGAGGQAVAEGLPFLQQVLKDSAQSQYTKALAPTKEANKVAAQKVVPGLIERGVVGSPTSIAEKASDNLATAGGAVRSAENAIPQGQTSNVTPVLQRLDQLKAKYSVGGTVPESRQGTTDYIDSLKNDIATRSQNGQMPTSDLIQFRRLLDEPVAQSGGFLGNRMQGNKAIDKAASNSMREILNSQNPDLAAANASYNFWSNVRQVASATAKRQTGQQGALKTMLTGVGMAGGFSHGGAQGAAAGAGMMYVLGHVMQSPQWRTASAVLKNRIADALATDNAQALVRAIGDFGASSASQLSAQPNAPSGNMLPTGLEFLRKSTTSSQ